MQADKRRIEIERQRLHEQPKLGKRLHYQQSSSQSGMPPVPSFDDKGVLGERKRDKDRDSHYKGDSSYKSDHHHHHGGSSGSHRDRDRERDKDRDRDRERDRYKSSNERRHR